MSQPQVSASPGSDTVLAPNHFNLNLNLAYFPWTHPRTSAGLLITSSSELNRSLAKKQQLEDGGYYAVGGFGCQ
jgi:hypothetical protein